jgi:hypothetical protein
MKITKVTLRFTTGLLCALLVFNSLPLNAAGLTEELRHEAFMRGGNAISAALNAPEKPAAVSKAIEESLPSAAPPAAVPPQQATSSSSGMRKPLWIALIGGFVATGIMLYVVANGTGASVRNCSTCSK